MIKINTPEEIRAPQELNITDNGMELVHELTGNPRNYLHSVSVERNNEEAINYLVEIGYKQLLGFCLNNKKYWEYIKQFPLSVAKWN